MHILLQLQFLVNEKEGSYSVLGVVESYVSMLNIEKHCLIKLWYILHMQQHLNKRRGTQEEEREEEQEKEGWRKEGSKARRKREWEGVKDKGRSGWRGRKEEGGKDRGGRNWGRQRKNPSTIRKCRVKACGSNIF